MRDFRRVTRSEISLVCGSLGGAQDRALFGGGFVAGAFDDGDSVMTERLFTVTVGGGVQGVPVRQRWRRWGGGGLADIKEISGV